MLPALLLLNTEDVISALNIFWKGMLAIAIVIALIICVTLLISLADRKIRETREAAENDPPEDGEQST